MTTVELVRHAEAHSRDEWWGKPDRDRPLNDQGAAQAERIAQQLEAGKPLDALYSSPYVRCVQTLAPLAERSGLPVIGVEDLGEAAAGRRAVDFLDRVAREHPGQRVVACSHGDVIPALMAVLASRDGVDLDDARLAKGAWFTLTFEGARCVGVARMSPD